jgi:hypothetical protein
MNSYRFVSNDQPWNNWLLFLEFKEDLRLIVRQRYDQLVCPKCNRANHDDVFDSGFDEGVRIRGRGDILTTDDGFLLFNQAAVTVLKQQRIRGVRLKEIPKTPWYVAQVTERRKFDQSVYVSHEPLCSACGRPDCITGLIDYESQIDIPKEGRTLFTTAVGFATLRRRDIFLTEDVVLALKASGLKGGEFMRLLNGKEEEAMKKSLATHGKSKWPKNVRVRL